MSRIEAPAPIKIEGLGGSFSRNGQMGEHGLGMRYDKPGDVFDLASVWENSHNAGTVLAPGMPRFIYIREAFKNGDNLITRIAPDGKVHRVSMQKDPWGGHFVREGRVESLLANPSYAQIRIAPESELSDEEARPVEVVRRLWGEFNAQEQIYSSKMKQLYGKDAHVPQATTEEEFNSAFSQGYDALENKNLEKIKILGLFEKDDKREVKKQARFKHRIMSRRKPYINPRRFFHSS